MGKDSSRLICTAFAGIAVLAWSQTALGWGFDVHRLINRSATTHLPPSFQAFAQWVDDLEQLATAADERKCCVAGESIKHYIDIDDYPEFFSGTLPHTYAAMVAMYGQSRVDGNGTVPWAIESNYALLVQHFQAGAWTNAVAIAADIGHYAGDQHSPLHLTVNYNGQLTGQTGIHSRHETTMANQHLAELEPDPGLASDLVNPLESVFDWIDVHYPGVQQILQADLIAKNAAGGSTSSSTYYNRLWQEVGDETIVWVRNASLAVASLWYSAYLDAGSPLLPGQQPTPTPPPQPHTFALQPVHPNPFNPSTTVNFTLPRDGYARLSVFDARGRLVHVLGEGVFTAGDQHAEWRGTDDAGAAVGSGTYFIRLEHAGDVLETKAILVR